MLISPRFNPRKLGLGFIPLALILLCLLLFVLHRRQSPQTADSNGRDLPQLKDSGELVVLTLYGPTSYFLYRGQEMGFQYELCKDFSDSLGLALRIITCASIPDMTQRLLTGEGDLIAFPLPVSRQGRDSLRFCGVETITHQVLVQQPGKAAKDVTELPGRTVHAKEGRYYNRMLNLNDELGGGIDIRPVGHDSLTVEELIALVAARKIEATVADDDIARLNRTYYPGIDIRLSVSFDQRLSWAVRPDAPLLAEAADNWFKQDRISPRYHASMRRYFEEEKSPTQAPILSVTEGRISHFDSLFRQYAPTAGWDWRLLASLAFKESRFDPAAVSWAGARGLMQLMPRTARLMGVPEGREHDPEESIKAAAKYLKKTGESLRQVTDPEQRIRFVLAAYNAGLGHILDAMALAKKYGKDPHVWEANVEEYILLKSHEEYFTDPVCRNGYFRGEETYNFVRDILARYEHYKALVKE